MRKYCSSMKITAYEEYGLRIILRLAKLQNNANTLVSLNEIASAEGISAENTAAILAKLKEAKLIESVRGKFGGYKLSKSPAEINLYQVVNGISKKTFDIDFCDSHSGNQEICVHANDCSVRSVWSSVHSLVNNFLASISLEKLMLREVDLNLEIQQNTDLIEVLQHV